MNSHWAELELGDFIELKRGYDLPKSKRVYGHYEIISSAGVTDYHNESKVKGPGVITGRYGTIGEVFYTEYDYWPLNTTLYVKDFKGNDPLFVYYLLHTINYLEYSDKAAVPGVNRNHLHKAVIKIPSDVGSQKAIAKHLEVLDRKITLNCKLNSTLEQIAQAIFKSWFVDFEPTKAKIAAREAILAENPTATPEQIATSEQQAAIQAIAGAGDIIPTEQLQIIADMFPNQMVDSELGEIPFSWNAGCFKDTCLKIESGGTPKRSEKSFWGAEIKWLTSGEVRDVFALDTKEKITQLGLEKSSAKLWPQKTCVIAMYGATAGQVCLLANSMSTNQACCGLIPKLGFESFNFLSARFSIDELASKASGSAQQNLNKRLISEHPIVVPNENLVRKFEEIIAPLIQKCISNNTQNNVLSSLLDELLPKLLAGEINTAPEVKL